MKSIKAADLHAAVRDMIMDANRVLGKDVYNAFQT